MTSILATKIHFILYVKDQTRSTAFYSQVFACSPSLNVPGMTEFILLENCVLGLMPETGIKRLLGNHLPNPAQATGVPRSEIYLRVNYPIDYHQRSIEAGAIELSGLDDRDWGDRVAYSLDPDGHVLAFAEKIESEPK
ncbi:MAG: glyoxalase [Anaerolineales bacterium]|nr:glyoxalase [Anaerolineales bacterium]